MKNVVELFNLLHGNLPFDQKYPQYDSEDRLVHVLYLSPFLNATGYYRMIAPMLEMNRTSTHRAIINQVHKWDFSKKFDQYDNPLDERLIHWAHYIVLPSVFSDVRYVVELIENENPDAVLIMDVDQNYFDLPEEHPMSGKMSEEMKNQLLENLFQMNKVTTSTELLSERVLEKMQGREETPEVVTLESFLSREGFKEAQEKRPPKKMDEPVRVGLIGSAADLNDFQELLPVLEEIQKEEKDMELVIFGWNGMSKGENKAGELFFRFIKPLRIVDYPARLRELELDMLLLPLKESQFNKGKTSVKFLEAAASGIPVIASGVLPFKDKIEDGNNGLLCSTSEQWKEKIKLLLKDREMRKILSDTARKKVWTEYSYEAGAIENHLSIFR